MAARQEQINTFFDDFQNLVGQLPEFDITDGLVSDDFSADERIIHVVVSIAVGLI